MLVRPGLGIIPAYAGSTSSATVATFASGDHPRVCGEHYAPIFVSCLWVWIIPAYAGSTQTFMQCKQTVWDHPRVCGEHSMSTTRRNPVAGSSPRMRGAHLRTCNVGIRHGIIPAYAGSTVASHCGGIESQDHPRVCGEHRRIYRIKSIYIGIIPAYAGSTFRSYR